MKKQILRREQNIQALLAAVQMGHSNLEDNPGYDRSFLNEVLLEQNQDRLDIEKTRKRIKSLTTSQD